MRRVISLALLVLLVLLTGCSSLTASEVSHQAMRGCPVTRELHIDSTLTTTTTRVLCAQARGGDR